MKSTAGLTIRRSVGSQEAGNCVKVQQIGAIPGASAYQERGIFTERRAIQPPIGPALMLRMGKRWFQFPIHA